MLAFLTAALTTQVYPGRYPALMGQARGHGHALFALAARNGLLIGWYVVAIHRLAKHGAPLGRLEAGAGTLPGPYCPCGRAAIGREPLTGVGPGCQSRLSPGDLNVEAQ